MLLACIFIGIPLIGFCAWIAFMVDALCDGEYGRAALLMILAIVIAVILRILIGHW